MVKVIAVVSLTTLGYFLLGVAGLAVATSPGYSTIIWPASGLAVAAVMFFPRFAPFGVLLGSFLVNMGATWVNHATFALLLPFLIAVGSTLQACVGAYLAHRFIGIPLRFHRIRLVSRFVFLVAVLSTVIGASVGSGALLYLDVIDKGSLLTNWLIWWGGDMIGLLIAVPFLAICFPRYFDNHFEHPWRLLGGFLFVLVLTSALSLGASYSEWHKQSKEFRANAQLLEVLLSNRVKNTVDILYGFVGLVKSSERLEASEFESFATNIMQRDGSIRGVSLNFSVFGNDLDTFEEEIQKNYLDYSFEVKEKNTDGQFVPVTPRERHIVVTFISPTDGNREALGYDIYSQSDRKFALDRAISLRDVYPTAPIRLVQSTDGILLFLPFFDQTTDEFLGVATAVIELDELTNLIVKRGLLSNTELYLVDMNEARGQPILVTKNQSASLPVNELIARYEMDDFSHAVSFSVDVGGKSWQLFQTSDSYFFKQPWLAHFILACGFLITGLFGWFLLIVSGHAAEVENEVIVRTRDLQLVNKHLKDSELAQSKAKEEAENANRAKSQFLANMSHEIRTPLNGVIGCLSLLISTKLQVDQLNLAKLSQRSAESLLDIVNDILDLSKIEMGDLILEKEAFELRNLIEEVANMFTLKTEEKGITLNVPASLIPKMNLLGDRLRIKQVLVNLIGNAVKFTEKGEVSLRLNIEPLSEKSVVLRVVIVDTGIGVSKENQQHLFQRFKQADGSTTRKFGGTGLGLAISKEMIEAMDGDISLASVEGEGSSFTFKIPLDIGVNSEEIETISYDAKVTLVYKNKTGREYLEALLNSLNVKYDSYSSLAQALSESSWNGDVVLLDAGALTYASALDISRLEEIHATKKMQRVLLHEHSNTDFDLKGYDASLIKPIFSNSLVNVLKNLNPLHLGAPSMALKDVDMTAENRPLFQAKVLLAEDNLTNQIVARGLLNLYGVDVVIAENGEKAVDQAKATKFDLIFMDCQMPIMDGYEATRQIRQLTEEQTAQDVPIIALSANAMKGDEDECFAAGMNDHIAKPVSQDKLIAILTKWLS